MNSILKNSFKQQFKRKPQNITLEMLGKKKKNHHLVSLCSLEHFTVKTTTQTSPEVL